MTIDDVVTHYGSTALAAKALGITTQAISFWRTERGKGVVPVGMQYRIQIETGGALTAVQTAA